ncbi:MAG: hypothetical protein MJ114_06460 [Acetatifactor sp.]|nr:hypothetical protein [Acetatifactor sp.]
MSSMRLVPYPVLVGMVVAAILALVFFSASLVLRLEDEKGRRKPAPFLPLIFALALTMSEMAFLRTIFLGMTLSGSGAFFQEVPWSIHIVLLLIMLGTAVWSMAREIRYRQTHFVRSSIKEAVDTMPVGLCFADQEGRQVLTNQSMIRFAEQLTGHTLSNVFSFLREIKEDRLAENCIRMDLFENEDEDIYTFRMQDGRVLQLTRDLVTVAEEEYVQLVVTDITMQHDFYDDLTKTNAALLTQRKEMRSLADRLIQSNHEEELLNYKIQVHNDVGQMIMTADQALKSGSMQEMQECATQWISLVERFTNMEDEKNRGSSELLEEIIKVAEQIGCKVFFRTDLPEQIATQSVVRQAIREAIVNAVKHGRANEVTIAHRQVGRMIEITISNNGMLPAKGFSMKGGLKNLYESIRGDGGDLRAETGERFALVLTLPYMAREERK